MRAAMRTTRVRQDPRGALPPLRRFTVDEYHRMEARGIFKPDERLELLEGAILVMAPMGSLHAGTVIQVTTVLHNRLAGRSLVSSQIPIHLSDHSELEPDVALLRPRADFYKESIATPVDVLLVIEVSDSSLRYDRGAKLRSYAEAGIPEAWIMIVRRKQIAVHRTPIAGRYQDVFSVGRGGTLAPLAFPDLTLSAVELLG